MMTYENMASIHAMFMIYLYYFKRIPNYTVMRKTCFFSANVGGNEPESAYLNF